MVYRKLLGFTLDIIVGMMLGAPVVSPFDGSILMVLGSPVGSPLGSLIIMVLEVRVW